jgi:citrate synthase
LFWPCHEWSLWTSIWSILIHTINESEMSFDFVTASIACDTLRISRATLYAYASRGLIRTCADSQDPRRRLYDLRDIEKIQKRKAIGKRPSEIAARALEWGHPVLVSQITCIEDQQFLYRGRDAIEWSRHADVEQTAGLLWDCPLDQLLNAGAEITDKRRWRRALHLVENIDAVQRCQILLALAGSGSTPVSRQPPDDLIPVAMGLVRATAAAVTLGWPGHLPIHQYLARAWNLDGDGAGILRQALVLLADYELNTPTFAARVIASTGASINASLIGALGALAGPQNGGQIERVEELFGEFERVGNAASVVELRLHHGDGLPGFGDELAPAGDPRAVALMASLPADAEREALMQAMLSIAGKRLTMDFALVSMRRALKLPADAAMSLFAVGRSVGLLAHILEQRRSGRVIRPRALYSGSTKAPLAER